MVSVEEKHQKISNKNQMLESIVSTFDAFFHVTMGSKIKVKHST